jgi:hypothetical protein
MQRIQSTEIQFAAKCLLKGFEGGAVYAAEHDGKYYIIEDESSMATFLDEDDLEGIELKRVLEFDTESERQEYINQRGWPG